MLKLHQRVLFVRPPVDLGAHGCELGENGVDDELGKRLVWSHSSGEGSI